MLHLVAFSCHDSAALIQLQSQLAVDDVLVLCEAALDWPSDHPVLASRKHLFLTATGASHDQLGQWLADHPQSLYWASSPTTSSSG